MISVLIVVLGASTAFSFGYLKRRLEQAGADYRDTKAKIVPLRKDYWLAWWAATKVGFWVFAVGFILAVWVFHAAKQ